VPNTIPNTLPNTIPNTVPNTIPNTVPNTVPTTIPNTTPPIVEPSKTARCSVEAASKNQESEELAKSLASRADQLSLCFAPLLNAPFDGGVRIGYQFGRGKGPSRFETNKNTFNNEQVIVCLKTAVQMAAHPESKTSREAQIFVKANGGGGKLADCKIAASVPQRAKGGKGPKPTWWNPEQPTYPDYGGYGGYGGGY
jgi:hypothetical protein